MTSAVMAFRADGPLSRRWLPVACSADIADGPAAVRLLDRGLVLWRSPSRFVVAAPDKCTHSKGDLTRGEVTDGRLVCPKHGWTFGDEGHCVFKPSGLPIAEKAHLKTHPCTEQYGLVWVSLEEPADPVTDLAWDRDDRYRRIHCAVSVWQSNPVRIIETLLAEANSSFVDVGAEVPFMVRGTLKSADGIAHHRLVACAPVDNRKSLVTSVVWTSSGEPDDAKIVDEVTADLDRVRAAVESEGGPSTAAEHTTAADWKRRLLDFVGQGVA
jgi:nitrite reductase/ring-hydroxylating ferredoxin subunit